MPKFLNNCRICNSTNLVDTIDLGEMHLTGVFVNKDQPLPIKSPLSLLFCNECKYLQIDKSVNPNLMYKEYWYRSGANNTMQSHLKGIYDEIINKINLDNDSFIEMVKIPEKKRRGFYFLRSRVLLRRTS